MIFPTCCMLSVDRDSGEERECGGVSKYAHRDNNEHERLYCCKDCYNEMDQDIQEEWRYVGMMR